MCLKKRGRTSSPNRTWLGTARKGASESDACRWSSGWCWAVERAGHESTHRRMNLQPATIGSAHPSRARLPCCEAGVCVRKRMAPVRHKSLGFIHICDAWPFRPSISGHCGDHNHLSALGERRASLHPLKEAAADGNLPSKLVQECRVVLVSRRSSGDGRDAHLSIRVLGCSLCSVSCSSSCSHIHIRSQAESGPRVMADTVCIRMVLIHLF